MDATMMGVDDTGGQVDWGHLNAGDTHFGDPSSRYELLPEEEDGALRSWQGQPELPSAASPMGRGRTSEGMKGEVLGQGCAADISLRNADAAGVMTQPGSQGCNPYCV